MLLSGLGLDVQDTCEKQQRILIGLTLIHLRSNRVDEGDSKVRRQAAKLACGLLKYMAEQQSEGSA